MSEKTMQAALAKRTALKKQYADTQSQIAKLKAALPDIERGIISAEKAIAAHFLSAPGPEKATAAVKAKPKSNKAKPAGSLEPCVLSQLDKKTPVSMGAIQKAVKARGFSPTSAGTLMTALVNAKKVIRVKRGAYLLA